MNSGHMPSRSGLELLVAFAAAVIALAGMWLARGLIGPLAVAAVIVIICHPLRHPVERWGWPRWAATTAVIVAANLTLALLAVLLAFAGSQFIRLVRGLSDEIQSTTESVVSWFQSLGLEIRSGDVSREVLDPLSLLGHAATLGGTAIGIVTAFFFVLAYVIFMAADASRYARAEQAFGRGIHPTIVRIKAFNASVRRYYIVNAAFGAAVAVVDGVALWLLGVPAPFVWAILAFVTNFIPTIGFVIGLVPPSLLALIVGGWPLLLAVVAVYIVINVTLQVVIQPKFVSSAVHLSLTLGSFSVIFWTFILGPLGAILSIPLTLLVRELVLGMGSGHRWLRWLTGDPSAHS